MAVDIDIYAEARTGKKGKPYRFIGYLEGERSYMMFTAMGYKLNNFKPLYKAKGLPGDVTKGVYLQYKKYDCTFSPSWLSTQELMDCINFCENMLREEEDDDFEILDSYRNIYEVLKEYEDKGEAARIVFWFDQ